MAYLDNTVITVDAVLTKKGRERLGQGRDAFNITKFAVSDDEIDYSLYNTAHPLGSTYYSNIIESMPVLEAIPDESQTMRYKLASMSVGLKRLPILAGTGVPASMTLQVGEGGESVKPKTIMYTTTGGDIDPSSTLDSTQGYTIILFDEEAATITVQSPLAGSGARFEGDQNVSPLINFSSTIVKAGFEFVISPKAVTATRNTKITIFGNESGVTKTFPLTVNPITS